MSKGMPKQGTSEQIWANGLTNKALGYRLGFLRNSRRAFNKAEADALLEEAEKRLTWPDNYDKHLDGEFGRMDEGEVESAERRVADLESQQEALQEKLIKARAEMSRAQAEYGRMDAVQPRIKKS